MRLLISLLAGVFVAGASGEAEAKYSLCNKTSYTVSAAIGYVDGDRLATRGWWRLRAGQCKVVLTEPTNPGRYFVFAEAIAGHRGPRRTWSGETPLCVENEGFFNLRNQEICRDDPSKQRAFFDVEVTPSAGGNWQTDFAEAPNFTVYSAEVAGVQRLLQDVGRDVRTIDGTLGRDTLKIIQTYRKEKGLADGGVDDALIDALIEDANAREAKLGLFYCNKAEQAVWSAIAVPEGEGRYSSRGWWKLEPGACSKVVKGELKQDHFYVYGVIEEGRNERRLAGGDKAFCVNAVKFDISNELTCADQDFDEAIFHRFDVRGAPNATFTFEGPAFVGPPTTQ